MEPNEKDKMESVIGQDLMDWDDMDKDGNDEWDDNWIENWDESDDAEPEEEEPKSKGITKTPEEIAAEGMALMAAKETELTPAEELSESGQPQQRVIRRHSILKRGSLDDYEGDAYEEVLMEPELKEGLLYRCVTQWTEELFIDFYDQIRVKHGAGKVVTLGFMILLGGSAIIMVTQGVFLPSLIVLALAFGYPRALFHFTKLLAKQQFKQAGSPRGRTEIYDFYEDRVITKDEQGELEVYYGDLYAVWESKIAFYLMVGKRQGVTLPKDAMEEPLVEFLRDMM